MTENGRSLRRAGNGLGKRHINYHYRPNRENFNSAVRTTRKTTLLRGLGSYEGKRSEKPRRKHGGRSERLGGVRL